MTQALTYRDTKGSLLTSAEVDANFRNLHARPQGMVNRLRNPKLLFAQRGTSISSLSTANTGAYTLDGWQWMASGTSAVVTVSQSTSVPTGAEYDFSLRVTVNTADAAVAAGDVAAIRQPIEGFLVRDLVGNPIAIRFDVISSKTGTHTLALYNSVADRSYLLSYTVNAASTWETKTLTIPAGLITAGTWQWTTGAGLYVSWTLMAGSTYQNASTGTWLTGQYHGATGSANVFDTAGNIFGIGCPQVERGYESGAIEHRSITDEELLNFRYYEASKNMSFMYPSPSSGGYAMTFPWYFKARKRTVPTVSPSISSMTNVSSSGAWNTTEDAYMYQVVSTTSTNTSFTFFGTATAEL